MNWVWLIGGTWIAVGTALAVLIGRSIHLASLHAEQSEAADSPDTTTGSSGPVEPVAERRPHAGRRQNSSRSLQFTRHSSEEAPPRPRESPPSATPERCDQESNRTAGAHPLGLGRPLG